MCNWTGLAEQAEHISTNAQEVAVLLDKVEDWQSYEQYEDEIADYLEDIRDTLNSIERELY